MKQAFRLAQQVVLASFVGFGAFSSIGALGQDGVGAPTTGGNSPPVVRLVSPEDGAKFMAPATIQLAAQAEDRDGWVRTVEFFVFDRSLGVTTNNPLNASPLNPFMLSWPNVPAGEYSLKAQATDDKGASTLSASVRITVLAVPFPAEVSLAAIKGEATENGDATSRSLIFRFSRTGSRDFALPVFYSVKGTASMGQDYPSLSGNLTIPIGEESAELSFEVIDDPLAEPAETVVLRVEPPICITIYPPPPECYRVGARAEAHGVIAASDQPPGEPPVVSIVAAVAETIEPSPEVRVAPGRFRVARTGEARSPLLVWLEIGGTAESGRDYEAFARSVLFEAGVSSKEILVAPFDDQLVEGDESVVAEIVVVPPNIDGMPTQDIPYPTQYLIDPEHKAAKVVIHDNDRAVGVSTLEITTPKDGAEYRAPALVRIEATAIDPLGDIRLVNFYANGQWIGKSEHLTRDAVIPGRPRQHVFEWKDVPAGRYELAAKATDTAGKEVVSKPVHIAVFGATEIPVVGIEAVIAETGEPSPLSLVRPGRFMISLRGGGDGTFPVFFEIGGSARNGEDYKKISKWVIVPGNTNSVSVDIAALDDGLVEGDESVEIKLTTQQSDDFPLAMPIREYRIDPEHASARVVIHDNDKPAATARIEITSPKNGEEFFSPAVIAIAATAIDPTGYISRVEFYVGEMKIGVSELVFVRAPDPGTPIHHAFDWKNPPFGVHVLTARATLGNGSVLSSSAIRITVGGGVDLPVVGIRFVPDPRDMAWPDADFAPGWFEISRKGSTNNPLTVFIDVGGTATPGVDYAELPRPVVIPAGASQIRLMVEAKDDLLPEGDETVVVALMSSPPTATDDTILRAGYRIDPEHAKASLVILDNDRKPGNATLEITSPKDGESFVDPALIAIAATAIDPNGYIPRVEFYAGEERIGVSELSFIRAPDPGTPIHHNFEWKQPPAGSHVLTARAVDSLGNKVLSKPVNISVVRAGERVVVSIEATDPKASEPGGLENAVDTATFTVRRAAGPRDVEVIVSYALDGTASNGIDYRELSGRVTLPAGETSAKIVVVPISDKAIEGDETVLVKIQEPICPQIFPLPPSCYQIAMPGSASAVIQDHRGDGQPPEVVIIRPPSGAVFGSDAEIEIVAEARDPNGYVPKVEFLADGRTIGAQSIAFVLPPPPGETQKFQFAWHDPTPGPHVLMVRATDNDGEVGVSKPVEIQVRGDDSVPVVRVLTRDAFAVEPESNSDVNAAAFQIRRYGSTNEALTVNYSLQGTAENGIDYEKLSGVATIAAGMNSATVTVRPLPDNLTERTETVVLVLGSPGSQDRPYRVKGPQRAAAVIRDALSPRALAEAAAETKVTALPEGLLHFRFKGETGAKFRVEATNDFVNWETVADAIVVADGNVDFVDDSAKSRLKFYRIIAEPDSTRED